MKNKWLDLPILIVIKFQMKTLKNLILLVVALLFWNCPRREDTIPCEYTPPPVPGFKVFQIIKYIDPIKTTDWTKPVYVDERIEVSQLKVNCKYVAVANEPNATYAWNGDKDLDNKQTSLELYFDKQYVESGYTVQLEGFIKDKCWPYTKRPIDAKVTYPVSMGKNLLNLSFAGAFMDSLNVPVIMTFKNGCYGDKTKPSLYVSKSMVKYCSNVALNYYYSSDTILYNDGPYLLGGIGCTAPCGDFSNIYQFENFLILLKKDSIQVISTFSDNGFYNRIFKGKKI